MKNKIVLIVILLVSSFLAWFYSRKKIYRYKYLYGEYDAPTWAFFLQGEIFDELKIPGSSPLSWHLDSFSGINVPHDWIELTFAASSFEDVKKETAAYFPVWKYRIVDVNESQLTKILNNE